MTNPTQTREIEIKLSLTPEEHEALASRLAPRLALLEQVNLYFDTPRDALRARGWSVRCRRENGDVSLTVKASRKDLGDYVQRSEWTSALPAETWTALVSGATPVTPHVEALARREGFTVPAELSSEALRPLGVTETRREVFALPGAGLSLRAELDATRYPDGALLHELELEVPDGPDTAPATGRLRAVFEGLTIPWRVSKVTKQARFREALARTGRE